MRVYHAYQDKRAHMMEFIEKFRANGVLVFRMLFVLLLLHGKT